MKKIVLVAFALAVIPSVTACNTVEGVGKDVEATGEVVQDAATSVKEEMTDDEE